MALQFTLLMVAITATLSILPKELARYQVIGGTTVTNSGGSFVHGDIALYPGTSVTGFPPGGLSGKMEIANPTALLAQTALIAFYLQLSKLGCKYNHTTVELGGKTLLPGVHCFSSSATITGTLTLDAQNQTAPHWIFQIGTSLDSSANSAVNIVNGTNTPCNVFWNVGSSVTLGTSSNFKGIINAYTSISISSTANIEGKLFAQNGAVTLLGNQITNCTEVLSASLLCFGLNSTNANVCSRNGNCTLPDSCFCTTGYVGNQCQNFTCFSKSLADPAICSGNGICSSLNNCTCNAGFSGNQCQNGTTPQISPMVPMNSPGSSPKPSPKMSSAPNTPMTSPKVSSAPNAPKASPKISSAPNSPKASPKVSITPNTPKTSPKMSNAPNGPKVSAKNSSGTTNPVTSIASKFSITIIGIITSLVLIL